MGQLDKHVGTFLSKVLRNLPESWKSVASATGLQQILQLPASRLKDTKGCVRLELNDAKKIVVITNP